MRQLQKIILCKDQLGWIEDKMKSRETVKRKWVNSILLVGVVGQPGRLSALGADDLSSNLSDPIFIKNGGCEQHFT